MEFIEILKKRRSTRNFLNKAVEPEKLQQLMATLQYIPSSRSIFPTAFIVVNEKEILKKLSECRFTGSAFLENSQVAIVVMADSIKSDVWVEDATIASTYILLSAVELGLAACWIQVRKRKKGKISADALISDILNIPPNFSVECMIALGYANDKEVKEKKKHFDLENIYTNQFHNK